MLARCRTLNKGWGLELLAVLVLALLVRLFGASVALPQREGFVPLCLGSEIVYLSVEPVNPQGSESPDTHKNDVPVQHSPCIWSGHFFGILPFLLALIVFFTRSYVQKPLTRTFVHVFRNIKPFHSQAPPLVIA